MLKYPALRAFVLVISLFVLSQATSVFADYRVKVTDCLLVRKVLVQAAKTGWSGTHQQQLENIYTDISRSLRARAIAIMISRGFLVNKDSIANLSCPTVVPVVMNATMSGTVLTWTDAQGAYNNTLRLVLQSRADNVSNTTEDNITEINENFINQHSVDLAKFDNLVSGRYAAYVRIDASFMDLSGFLPEVGPFYIDYVRPVVNSKSEVTTNEVQLNTPQAKSGDSVAVYFTGTLDDGSLFDGSVLYTGPIDLQAGYDDMILPGFAEQIVGMHIGETKKFRIEASKFATHKSFLITKPAALYQTFSDTGFKGYGTVWVPLTIVPQAMRYVGGGWIQSDQSVARVVALSGSQAQVLAPNSVNPFIGSKFQPGDYGKLSDGSEFYVAYGTGSTLSVLVAPAHPPLPGDPTRFCTFGVVEISSIYDDNSSIVVSVPPLPSAVNFEVRLEKIFSSKQ